MQSKHQQMIPADMQPHPRPGEREIFVKTASQTHLERPLCAEGRSNE
ncbi:MAG: hypothetical protein RR821_10415 [Clostridia bacterium]